MTRKRGSRTFPSPIDRLLSKCVEVDGCWHYTGRTERKGYARIRGEGGRKMYGHRIAYEFFVGEIPEGLSYDHLCENTSCPNPWHGELVPIGVNIRRASRGMGAVNRQKTHCPKGHPLEGDNLVRSAPGRICRTCRNEANRRYRARVAERNAA